MYLHYCYLLGILPKNRLSISAKQVHVLFREDLLKLNTVSKETKLLCHYHIDTAEQLFLLKESLQKKMEQCVEERKHLRYKIQGRQTGRRNTGNEGADKSSDRENRNAQKGDSTL